MILLFMASFFSIANAQPCTKCSKGVGAQINAIQTQFVSPGQCITHDPGKTVEAEVAGLSDEEVMARLVLAETYATKCTDGPTDGIMNGIATIIANRVKHGGTQYGNGIHGVIFKPAQFNSSLSTSYSRSQYVRFLCPVKNSRDAKEAQMWADAKAAVARANNPATPNYLGSDDVTITYYFKHFLPLKKEPPCFANPNSPNRIQLRNSNADPACIGFFYNRTCKK